MKKVEIKVWFFSNLGAVCIEDENGKRINISPFDPIQREAMAKTLLISSTDTEGSETKNKFVHRHLRNGDAMLLNRQPTLHKPSILSHRYLEKQFVQKLICIRINKQNMASVIEVWLFSQESPFSLPEPVC